MFILSKRKWVIKETMKGLNISKEEAIKRVDALLKSGILEEGSPEETWTQMRIENFLRFDLSKLDYKDVFQHTMRFPALILEYDKISGQHLTETLKAIHGNDYDFEDVKEQIQTFDKFFCKHIWNYFPNVEHFDCNKKVN